MISTLDTSRLLGGGLELGAGGTPQTLFIGSTGAGNSDPYIGGLKIRSGSEVYFSGNFILDPGERLFNNGYLEANGITINGGTFGGTGEFGLVDPLIFGNNATLAPGGSVGTTTPGVDTLWAGPFTFQLEISDATGSIGSNPGWDLFSIASFDLDITALAVGDVTIDLTSVLSADGTTGGLADNFDPSTAYSWDFVEYGSLTGAFASDLFTVDTTNFANAFTGTFAVADTGSTFRLNYTPGAGGGGGVGAIPEPATMALFTMILLAGFITVQRCRRGTCSAV